MANGNPVVRKRIVQVAPDFYPVPPRLYGGIERMVHELTEALVSQGYEVILYARPGSQTRARLMAYEHEGSNPQAIAEFVERTLPADTDIIHDHTHQSVIGRKTLGIPTVCSIHDNLNNPVANPVYLSRRSLEQIGRGVGSYVYNGIDVEAYPFQEAKEPYLLFLGVLNWHKGINHAIDVAVATGKKLVIAGPVFNQDYFKQEIEPRIRDNATIEYVGEVGGEQRLDLLKHAECLLFPTSWEEPFGLVMIEAMACGTPVLALGNGAVREVLDRYPHLVCDSVEDMCAQAAHARYPAPRELRDYVREHFSADLMVSRYIDLYSELWASRPTAPMPATASRVTDGKAGHTGNWRRVVESCVQAGRYEEAINVCEKILGSSDVTCEAKALACEKAADSCYRMEDFVRERAYATKSFAYDNPRAEICCRLGYQHLQRNELEDAVFWYELASRLPKPDHYDWRAYEACWTWLPQVQLCICQYRLGHYDAAYRHNEKALEMNPNNEYARNNKTLLEPLIDASAAAKEREIPLLNARGGTFSMELKLPGFIEETIEREGGWEPQLAQFLSHFTDNGSLFLDIGANIGYHALYLASMFPDLTCLAFEPHPDIFRQLERNARLNDFGQKFAIREVAIGDANGRTSFYMQTEDCYNRGMSAIAHYTNLGHAYRVIEVEQATLDSMLSDEQKSRVSVMKIDTQGNERQVLLGARDIIRHSQPIVALELHDDSRLSLHELMPLLEGYRIYKIQPWTGELRSMNEEDPSGFQNDYVCISEKRFPSFEALLCGWPAMKRASG